MAKEQPHGVRRITDKTVAFSPDSYKFVKNKKIEKSIDFFIRIGYNHVTGVEINRVVLIFLYVSADYMPAFAACDRVGA